MKVDWIPFQSTEVIDKYHTLLHAGADSLRVSMPHFQSWLLRQVKYQLKSIESHNLRVERIDSGIKQMIYLEIGKVD